MLQLTCKILKHVRLKSDDNGRSNKVIVKFTKRKDMVMSNEQKEVLKKS